LKEDRFRRAEKLIAGLLESSPDAPVKDIVDVIKRVSLEVPHESVIEHAGFTVHLVTDRGVCYSADTDVLTNEGWKPWPEVRGDEKFLTLRSDGGTEYQAAQTVVREQYAGPMYSLRTSLINLCVTPEHKLYVQKHDTQAAKRGEEPWQLIPAQDIAGKRVKYRRNAVIRPEGPVMFEIPNFVTEQGNRFGRVQPHTRKGRSIPATLYAKFLGYWLSEGGLDHTPGGGYVIELYQNVGPVLDEILTIIREMGYEPRVSPNGDSSVNMVVSFCDVALFQILAPYRGSLNKRIPREILTTFRGSDLMELILRYVAGDGSTHHENGHMQAYTSSPGMAGDLQEAALHAGISATIWVDDRVGLPGGVLGIVHRHPSYVVSFVTAKNTPLVNHGAKTFKGEPHESWVEYDGPVYCVKVPNHTLYVRRNGRPCWSGNSHEMVRHRLAAFSQESTRYCNYGKKGDVTFVQPPFWIGSEDEADKRKQLIWENAMKNTEDAYMALLTDGASPQEARDVLPNSLKTEIVVTANLREWRHILKLRTSPKAHPQMRQVMIPLLAELKERLPPIFEDIGE